MNYVLLRPTFSAPERPEVLVFCDYYLPAVRAGGAVRSLANLVETLSFRLEFHILTRDRDLGTTTPFPEAHSGHWIQQGGARVRYLPPGLSGLPAIIRGALAHRRGPIYFNSLFSPRFTLLPLLLAGFPRRSVSLILAPRGELGAGALAIKARKKHLYLRLFRWLRLHRRVLWHASTEQERADILTHFPDAQVQVARDLFLPPERPPAGFPEKAPGSLRIVFLSRICPIKNLLFALDRLAEMKGEVTFDIFGPVEDRAYWTRCQQRICQMPPGIRVRYRGEVPPGQVVERLSRYHLLFLPTGGENFGHVILEALTAGCPILISDRTPWRSLADSSFAWQHPLESPELFRRTLSMLLEMPGKKWRECARMARKTGMELARTPRVTANNLALFVPPEEKRCTSCS